MKISLRFLYLLPVLGVICTDRAFTEFVFPDEDTPMLALYGLMLMAVALANTVLFFRRMEPLMKNWLLLIIAVLFALSLESYAGWHSWMVYPHVFNKFLVMLHLFSVYAFHRRFGLPPFGQLMGLILLGLVLNLLIYHRDALSLSAFLGNERGFGSTQALLLLLPTLYYFNQYLTFGGMMRLLLFFSGAVLIIFLQHRSVWVTMGAALALNAVLLAFGRVAGAQINTKRLLPMVMLPVIVLISGGIVVLSDPKITRKLERSIQDIMNPTDQGTGSWRMKQFKAYTPFMHEYPIAGMRLKGFELPIQFYTLADDGGGDEPVWEDLTGHHFHSFYVDRIFYFGILGVLLTVLVPVILFVRRLIFPVPLSPPAAALTIFALSSLVYSISYDWPMYLFAVWGLAVAAAVLPVRRTMPVPAKLPEPSIMPLSAPSYANNATATA
jgi:hypothetical protein